MLYSDQTQPKAGSGAWKWLLGISVGATCAILVGGVGLALYPPPVETVSTPVLPQPLEAVGTATIGGTTPPTATVELAATPPAPAVLPPPKPRVVAAAAPTKPATSRAPARTGLAPFETCLPDCETRDPLVATAGPPAPAAPQMLMVVPAAPQPLPPQATTAEPSLSFLPPALLETLEEPIPTPPPPGPVDLAVDTGQALVEQVQGASTAVVNGTRRAIDGAVDLIR